MFFIFIKCKQLASVYENFLFLSHFGDIYKIDFHILGIKQKIFTYTLLGFSICNPYKKSKVLTGCFTQRPFFSYSRAEEL